MGNNNRTCKKNLMRKKDLIETVSDAFSIVLEDALFKLL